MRPAARCVAFALIAACGSPQPAPPDPLPPAAPASDAAPPPYTFAQPKSCLPDDEPDESSADAGLTPAPKVVQSSVLEVLRLTGRRGIEPAPAHRRPLWARHRRAVAVTAKFCIDTAGRVVSVRLLQASGYPPYDEQVTREISCWTFRPLVVDGVPAAACSINVTLFRTSPPGFAPAAP